VDRAKIFHFALLIVLLPVFVFAQTGLININTANSSELQSLNGIGPAYAQRIIDYRTQNGPFQKIEDIKKVSGIGDATYLKIKDYITVGTIDLSTQTSSSTASTTDSTTNNTNQNSSTNTTTETENTSVHYSSTPFSNVIPQIAYKVGAGRSRLGSVNTPIEFKGESNADFSSQTIYKWSFGDGAIGYGHMISHSYSYPGDYVVVLNATSPAGQAVSRVEVKIIPTDLVISYASPERIEIKNNSNYEINLFGRALEVSGKRFIFPEDTIIKSGQKISFISSITNLHPSNENDVSMIVVGDILNKSFVEPILVAQNKSDNQKQVEILYGQAKEIQKELSLLSNNSNYLASPITAIDSLPLSTSTTRISSRGWFDWLRLFFFGK